MTKVSLSTQSPEKSTADIIALGVQKTATGTELLTGTLSRAATQTAKKAWHCLPGQRAEVGACQIIPAPAGFQAQCLAFIGLGEETANPVNLREAMGQAVTQFAGVSEVGILLPLNTAAELEAVAEGLYLGSYTFTKYQSSTKTPVAQISVFVARADRELNQSLMRAQVAATATNLTRDLVNTAPNDLNPQTFAALAAEAAKQERIDVTVWDEKELTKHRCGGILAVGKGSVNGPRLVRLHYRGPHPRKSVALVGKGITFDSGGLSLKPAKSMETMKSDMAGAASVLAATLAAAQLKLPLEITTFLALAENMPSGQATRPSDIITMRDGTTVEVLNTDAEGRLVLADTLCLACQENPDFVIDMATLTGAQIVALGSRHAAVMGKAEIIDRVMAASSQAGEYFWPMPLPEHLVKGLDSKVADMCNTGPREGGMLTAGLFLKHFVGIIPWAHIDFAGPSYNESAAWGCTPAGGTGMGVRTILKLLQNACQ